MAVSFVGATYGTSAASSISRVPLTLTPSAAVGDIALVVAACRGSLTPSIAATSSSGYTSTYTAPTNTNLGAVFGWKRLTAADLAGDWEGATFDASVATARQINVACAVFRLAADPTFANGALVSSATTHTAPSITPSVDASMLVSLAALGLPNAPLTRTFTPSGTGTWTEDIDICNTSAGTNAAIHIAHQLLGGSTAGVSHTGLTSTPSDTSTALVSYRATFAIAPYDPAATPAGIDELRVFIKP